MAGVRFLILPVLPILCYLKLKSYVQKGSFFPSQTCGAGVPLSRCHYLCYAKLDYRCNNDDIATYF